MCRLRKIYLTNPGDLWPQRSNFKGHFRVKFENIFKKSLKIKKRWYNYLTSTCRLTKIYWTNPGDLWPQRSYFEVTSGSNLKILQKKSCKIRWRWQNYFTCTLDSEKYTQQIQVTFDPRWICKCPSQMFVLSEHNTL